MNNQTLRLAVRAIIALSAAVPMAGARAQQQIPKPPPFDDAAGGNATATVAAGGIEEIVVIGRQRQAATDVLEERIAEPVVADVVSIEQIRRVGDSTVAAALRRLPGVSLVGDFIYIRGLGERYSSTTLNGAKVPSPDLTRNVIPLDIFPASLIESLSIQKGFTVDQPAAFGGGNVDIRTRRIPEAFTFGIEAGTGWNSESSDDVLRYPGGGDDRWGTDDGTRALPREIRDGIQTYRGRFTPTNILGTLLQEGASPAPTLADAEAVNRDLATSLNRRIDFTEESPGADVSVKGGIGNSIYFGDEEQWRVGALLVGDYQTYWRNKERINRSATTPDIDNGVTQRSIETTAVTGSVTAGIDFTSDHSIGVMALYLRNTDDEAALTQRNNFNFRREQGAQLRDYRIRFEERELQTLQLTGRHRLGDDTLDAFEASYPENLSPGFRNFIQDLTFDWFYTDSTAESDIPNEVTVSSVDAINPDTGEVLQTSVRSTSSAGDFRFSDLRDDVYSWGGKFTKPLEMRNGDVVGEVFGGYDYYEKGRRYQQTQLGLGTTNSSASQVLVGTPGQVFSDQNILDPDNAFLLTLGGIGTESYLAGETIDAAFGGLDLTWIDTWRLSAGVRWEDWTQLSVPYNPLQFSTVVGKVPLTPEQLAAAAKAQDDYYPSAALTYMRPDFWAETFQLRFGWSQTTARPDLREVTASTYIDPFTDARVVGNPALVPSDLDNFDLRAEWFFTSGDNFTVTPFYKKIDRPIETIEGAGTDNNLSFTFINGDTAEIYGVELEWFKNLQFLGDWIGGWASGFFTAGNLTFSDSELEIDTTQLTLTNSKRPLTQQSDILANVQLGWDSPQDRHSATVAYTYYDERLYYAGRNGAPDAYEQPFNSLDLVYSWNPTDRISAKFRFQNLLDDDIEIDQGGVIVLEQSVGTTYKMDLAYRF